MKKKFVIASIIILIVFAVLLVISLLPSKQQPIQPPADQNQSLNQEKANLQTQDDLNFGQTVDKLYQQFPWYSEMPIVTDDFTIAFNFEKNSFRIILLQPATDSLKQSAVDKLKLIGIDTDQFKYYFVAPKAGF